MPQLKIIEMTTVKLTIDDTLPLPELRTFLSSISGVRSIEVAEFYDTEKQEYEQLRTAFLNNSKRSMAHQIKKYLL